MAETKVKLHSEELGETREHSIEHAERLFKLKVKHDWTIADKNFELNTHGNIVRISTAKNKKPGQSGSVAGSGTA